MTEIINDRIKVEFKRIYADFQSELGVWKEYPKVFKISIGDETLNCSNLAYTDVKRFVNSIKTKNGAHIIVHTNGLKDDSEATILYCISNSGDNVSRDVLKDTAWKHIQLLNRMGRMPEIAIGDTFEFTGEYPKANAVKIHSYSDTFFIDFEI